MDYVRLKNDLDRLYSELNEPSDVAPQWAEPGLTETEIQDQEVRLGIRLPENMRQALSVFSGISHETPLYQGVHFPALQKAVLLKSGRELTSDDFQDDLEICYLAPPQEWLNEELQALREVDDEALSMTDADEQIAVNADIAWLKHKRFFLVGATYSQSLYLNLIDEGHFDYGAFYNLQVLDPFVLLYKVAPNYQDFLQKIVDSLQRKINSED